MSDSIDPGLLPAVEDQQTDRYSPSYISVYASAYHNYQSAASVDNSSCDTTTDPSQQEVHYNYPTPPRVNVFSDDTTTTTSAPYFTSNVWQLTTWRSSHAPSDFPDYQEAIYGAQAAAITTNASDPHRTHRPGTKSITKRAALDTTPASTSSQKRRGTFPKFNPDWLQKVGKNVSDLDDVSNKRKLEDMIAGGVIRVNDSMVARVETNNSVISQSAQVSRHVPFASTLLMIGISRWSKSVEKASLYASLQPIPSSLTSR